ncbi:beta-lactamase family protein [Kitasatospora sp. NBC_00070]|uniref:serine hydrolase domain-containing protein n=1 Tax=Kitasatospora sp. NBC_00070 TaxID=2975962 RepID=UPI00324F1D58
MWQRIPSGRRAAWSAVAAALVAGLLTVGAAPAPSAAAGPDGVQQGLNALVRPGGVPAALASVQDRTGRSRTYTAGVGDLSTGGKVPNDGQVRIGSNTKTFTAVVVLQLVGEGKVALDEPIETYLPGLVRGDGIDGNRIKVRQLLQHTSGIPDYEGLIEETVLRDRYFEPRELLDLALRHKAEFAPGKGFRYSNTNYVLAGLLVQRVTGRPLPEEIDRRILKPLGLRHTSFPAAGDRTIREAHPKGYRRDAADGQLRDFTELDPSAGWAAGQMISTNTEVNRFFTALLAGRLLPAAQLAEMRTTVPIGDTGAGYGLGIISRPLPCGGVYWGHGGDIPGFESRGGVTEDGRAANVTVTTVPADDAGTRQVESVVEAALCR